MEKIKSELKEKTIENQELSRELQAVSHHRNVLRDAVEQQEKLVKSKIDAIADIQYQLPGLRGEHGEDTAVKRDDVEHYLKQISRYKARSLAMDELVVIYRTGLLALYADGHSYGAANYGWEQTNSRDSISVGWIERELFHVNHSYEEEIRLLDGEVSELRGKVKQSASYITELRKRFEENMKSLYR